MLINQYKELQDEIKDLIVKERAEKIEQRFKKIASDNSRATFWREKRALSKNPVLESLIIKDEKGKTDLLPRSNQRNNCQILPESVQWKKPPP